MNEWGTSTPGVPRRAVAAVATPVPIVLESQRPLPIDDTALALRVLRGHVDLFAVEQTEGASKGQRHHLLRADAGTTIFGLPRLEAADGHTCISVIAVGGQDTQVSVDHRDACSDRGLMDAWVKLLSAAIASDALEADAIPAEIGSRTALASGEAIRASGHHVAWVGIEQGTLRLLGAAPAGGTTDPPLPLASGTWASAEDNAVLTVRATEEFAMGEIRAGLDRFHALAIIYLSRRIAAASLAESERLRARSELDRLRTTGIVDRLARLIDRRAGDADHRERGDRNAMLAACREAGSAIGVVIEGPANIGSTGHDVPDVCQIAQASRIRARRVLLRGDWWTASVGPLVAFYREDRRPVAILPQARSRYVVVEPHTGIRREFTAAIASRLAAEAVMFYHTLPSRILRARDLLWFGVAAVGADILRILLAALGVGVLSMAAPLVTEVLIDSVIPRAEVDQLMICALALGVVTIVATGFRFMQGIAMLRLESLLDWVLQAAIVDRLLRMPAGFFRNYAAGDLADRALGVEAVRTIVGGRAVRALLAAVSCLLSFVLMFSYDVRLAFIAALLALIRAATVVATSLVRLPHERANFDLQGWLQGLVLQLITGVSKLRVANATTHALSVWVERFARQKWHFIASQRAANLLKSFEAAFPALATLVIFAAAGSTPSGKLFHNLGAFVAFFAAFGVSLAMVGEWATAIGELVVAIPRLDRLRPIISAETEIGDDRKVLGDLDGSIEFAKVSFRYAESGSPILDNIGLVVARGEYVSVVGPSGSGKSTLFRLLLGFEKPESGVIFVDGRSIETIDISSFRRQIGVVLQNSRLATGSIYENICGGTQLPLEQVWEAARMASLDRDIEAMPMGMQTWISEGVSTLSGGQRQRLLIARALVHRPRILLMDEATSALDNRTQAAVSEAVSRLNVTRLVIAHRLSTVQSADRIVVLDGGRIVQSGSYLELMAQEGLFAEFAARQLV